MNFSHRLARPIAEPRLSRLGSTAALAWMLGLAPTGGARGLSEGLPPRIAGAAAID